MINSEKVTGSVGEGYRRKELTWTFIKELNTPEHFKPSLLITLCKQIDDETLPYFKEAKTLGNRLEADARISDPAKMTLEQRYLPAISQLLSENDPESKRMRTTFADTFLGNGMPGQVLQDFSLTEQTLMDLLKIGMEKEQRIKELEAELKASKK